MEQATTYHGGCHCGKVRFDVNIDLAHVVACNCSICAKMGWLLAFVPAERFKLRQGEDALTDYQFGKKHVHHLFCATCGINSFSRGPNPRDGRDVFAVNVRCLEGVDPASLPIKHFDGKSL